MDDSSMWLQDSVMVPPDPLGGSLRDDLEEESRLMTNTKFSDPLPAIMSLPTTPVSSSLVARRAVVASGQPMSQRSAAHCNTMLAPAPIPAASSRCSTPLGTPTCSQQPLNSARPLRPSIANADFMLQQQFQQQSESLSHTKRELADAMEEVALLTKTMNTEKDAATMWRTRYQSEVVKADDALNSAQIRLRAALGERDEAVAAARRVESDFAAARAEWQRQSDNRGELRRQLDEALASKDASERQLRVVMRELDDSRAQVGDVQRLRDELATVEADFRAARDESNELQRQLEAFRVEAEMAQRNALDSQREDFQCEMRTVEDEWRSRFEEQRNAHAEQLASVRQRVSAGEQAREEARRAKELLDEERERVVCLDAELQRAKEATERTKQRMEAARIAEMQLMNQEHEDAIRRLIDEHNEERAELRRRLSQGDAASTRLQRLETDLNAERERADDLTTKLDDARREIADLRRQTTRREEQSENANKRAQEAEERLADAESRHADALARDRQVLHERIEGLLAQIEAANRDSAAEAEEFAEQLQDARHKQSAAEAALAEQRSNFSKERLTLMKNESNARAELLEAVHERDNAARSWRQAESRVSDAEAQVQALERRSRVLEQTIDELRDQCSALQREVHGRGDQQRSHQHYHAVAAPEAPAFVRSAFQTSDASQPPKSGAPSPSPAPINPSSVRAAQQQQFVLEHFASSAAHHDEHRKMMTAPLRSTQQQQQQQQSFMSSGAPSVPLTEVATPASRAPQHLQTESLVAATQQQQQQRQPSVSKRHRSEEPNNARRVFAVTGFDGNAMLDRITSLPEAEIAAVLPNAPIPATVTHLVTSGQLTVKLLTALVKGCWVLPESYVRASVEVGSWLPEEQFGFRHPRMILRGRVFAFTAAFRDTRHFNTAKLVATEGCADVRTDLAVEETCNMAGCTVLCTPSELNELRRSYPALHLMTWDLLVKMIYPPNALRGDHQ